MSFICEDFSYGLTGYMILNCCENKFFAVSYEDGDLKIVYEGGREEVFGLLAASAYNVTLSDDVNIDTVFINTDSFHNTECWMHLIGAEKAYRYGGLLVFILLALITTWIIGSICYSWYKYKFYATSKKLDKRELAVYRVQSKENKCKWCLFRFWEGFFSLPCWVCCRVGGIIFWKLCCYDTCVQIGSFFRNVFRSEYYGYTSWRECCCRCGKKDYTLVKIEEE